MPDNIHLRLKSCNYSNIICDNSNTGEAGGHRQWLGDGRGHETKASQQGEDGHAQVKKIPMDVFSKEAQIQNFSNI